LIGTGFWLDGNLRRIPALTDYAERPLAGRGTTWLLVGSDSRQGLSPEQQAELATGGDIGDGRTDTILVVHVPGLGSATEATMVSIPRDSYVQIPGHGEDKINAAFSIGGAALLAQTVEQATGLRLDHYAEIGFDGFAQMVDAVGGVTMCPQEPISDPLAGIDLPAGCQEFDGRTALGYVRTRATPRADLDRMLNQREFMSTLMRRAGSPVVLLNPLRWYPMVHAASGAVTVDDGAHIWDLVRLAWSLHGTVTTVTVPIGEFTGSDSGSVVVWNSDAADRLFTALAADEAVPPDVLEAGQP
jgi:LCP family protein required for cell wall assembly